MPRLTPEQLLAARRRKRESLMQTLVRGIMGTEREFHESIEAIDEVMFVAVEAALWHWFYQILPKHFGRKATATYGYPFRTKKYMVAKFTGNVESSAGPSKWRFPKDVAYALAGGKGGTGPDPYPLELSGTLKTRITAGPIGRNNGVRVRRVRGGYAGVMTLDTPAYIQREDLDALKRYTPADLDEMLGVVHRTVMLAFGTATTTRRVAYAS